MNAILLEKALLAIDTLLYRWRIVVLTVAVVSTLAVILVKTASHRYTTSVNVVLRAANLATWAPGGTQFPDQSAIEQVRAIEVWLKSDYVLENLLPQLIDTTAPLNPQRRQAELNKLRASLRLIAVGNSMMRLELDGPSPDGLSRKLEIILSNFFERLLRSDDGVLSATQLIQLRRGEDASAAEAALVNEIKFLGLDPAHAIRQLKELRLFTAAKANQTASSAKAPANVSTDADPFAAELQVRSSISPHAEIVRRLEILYEDALVARGNLERAQTAVRQKESTFVRIFETPENLTIIGRPRDPLFGENPMRKVGIAMILMGFGLGVALAFIVELLGDRMRSRDDFEMRSELPVIARMQRLPT